MSDNINYNELNDTQILELSENLKYDQYKNVPLIDTKRSLNDLLTEYENGNQNFIRKLKLLLNNGWNHYIRVRGDGNCFYRAFAYDYIKSITTSNELINENLNLLNERIENLTKSLNFDEEIVKFYFYWQY